MRGTPGGETPVSQAATDAYRDGHESTFRPYERGQRGRWVFDEAQGRLVRAEDYVPPSMAVNAPIIADRLHEGTTYDEGSGRVVDIGSRSKRREFMRSRGVEDASDASPQFLAAQKREKDRQVERSTDRAFDQAARKLYNERKLR